jgi:hypothetical protein
MNGGRGIGLRIHLVDDEVPLGAVASVVAKSVGRNGLVASGKRRGRVKVKSKAEQANCQRQVEQQG